MPSFFFFCYYFVYNMFKRTMPDVKISLLQTPVTLDQTKRWLLYRCPFIDKKSQYFLISNNQKKRTIRIKSNRLLHMINIVCNKTIYENKMALPCNRNNAKIDRKTEMLSCFNICILYPISCQIESVICISKRLYSYWTSPKRELEEIITTRGLF